MNFAFYLDRKKKPETTKAQIYYVFVYLFEGMVISFLTIFLNEAAKEFHWSKVMSSFSLFFPFFFASLSVFISSFFVSHQKKNLFLMRILLGFSFCLILLFPSFGLFLLSQGKEVSEEQSKLFFYLFLPFPSLLLGSHWSFLSFHCSCIADINYAEKTKYGHVCLYGVLASAISSPLAGYLAECLYTGVKGYLFLFLISSPLLLLLFAFTFFFHPFPSELFHADEDERVKSKELFSNRNYRFYLLLASLWIPSIWAMTSCASDLWTSYESSSSINAFNSLSWGCYLSVSYLAEFLIIFLNTHIGIGKKVTSSMTLAFLLILIETGAFALLSYFFRGEENASLLLVFLMIFLHSFKGMANGLYLTSNITVLTYILGPKKRRKAVFIAPCIYQLVNACLQLIYPYFNSKLYFAFTILFSLSLFGFILSLFFSHFILDSKKKD